MTKIKRELFLEELLGRVGESVVFRPPFYIDFGSNITVGDRFFANYNCTILDTAPITIEDGVWLGVGVTILDGVTIGYGSVVAAGATVTKDVPPMTVVAGTPAKILRHIR